MRLTYINIKENGECDFHDGFSCGLLLRIPTRESIMCHCSEGWYDERGVWIGNMENSKARYAQDQWMKIVEEIESGDLKPGLRIGWFRKADKKVADKIEKFRASLRKIGYDVTDGFVESIVKMEAKES